MQNLRPLVPVILFVAFALVHYAASNGSQNKLELLVVNEDLAPNTEIKATHVSSEFVTVPDLDAIWLKPFLRSDESADIVGQKLTHSILKGNLLSRLDFLETRAQLRELQDGEVGLQVPINGVDFVPGQIWIGSTLGFVVQEVNSADSVTQTRVLKPFRVVAVGDFVEAERGREEPGSQHNFRIITIAAKLEFDAVTQTEKLDAKSMDLVNATSPDRTSRIVSVVIIPPEKPKTSTTAKEQVPG